MRCGEKHWACLSELVTEACGWGAWVSRARSLARAPLATRPRRKNPRDACKIVKSSFHSFHARAAAGAHENPAISARVLTEDAGVFFAAFFFAIVATWR